MGQLDDTVGPFVIGAFISCWLSGLVWSQGTRYFNLFPKGADRPMFRYAVILLLIIDLPCTAFSCISAYKLTITWASAPRPILPWSFAMNPALLGVVTTVVQFFYAYRIYVMSKQRWAIPLIIAVLAVVQLGFATGASYIIWTHHIADLIPSYNFGFISYITTSVVADFLITGAVVYYLKKAQSTSGFSSTNGILNKIIRSTIENNLLTALISLVNALILCRWHKAWHVPFMLSLSHLYTLSLLSSLTARAHLGAHARSSGVPSGSGVQSGGTWREKSLGDSKGGVRESVIVVTTDREIVLEEGEEGDNQMETRRGRPLTYTASHESRAPLAPSSVLIAEEDSKEQLQ